MPLEDLLQWLSNSRKTGTLQVEWNRVRKCILLEEGRVTGCSSDDPPERLGQFLLSRGRITEDQLRIGLAAQESTPKHLGRIFVEMGAMAHDDLLAMLEAKAEETIYSLFDWDEAVFRFHEECAEEDNVFPVSLCVEDVLLRGMQRCDEVRMIRTVINDPALVLCRTAATPSAEILDSRMARTVYEAIDGERTVADILLHVHGSEFLVTKFLFELHRNELLEIVGLKPAPAQAAPGAVSAPPPPVEDSPPDASSAEPVGEPTRTVPDTADADEQPAGDAGGGFELADPPQGFDAEFFDPGELGDVAPVPEAEPVGLERIKNVVAQDPSPAEPVEVVAAEMLPDPAPASEPGTETEFAEVAHPAAVATEPADPTPTAAEAAEDDDLLDIPDMFAEPTDLEAVEDSAAYQLDSRLARARREMAEGNFEAAVLILDELYQAHPDDESLRRLTAEAEAAFVDKAYRHYVQATKLPVLTCAPEALESQNLSPSEFFLLSRIDGTWDVKSIIQIAPMREVEALLTLKHLREKGMIELRDPES
jgi:hypothetical protein